MIFQETWDKVLTRQKTQTRRLMQSGDMAWGGGLRSTEIGAVDSGSGRLKWQVGKTYAVQPSRTNAGIARIKIIAIRRERVQDISEEDARQEGCSPTPSNRAIGGFLPYKPARHWFAKLWNEIHTRKGERWEDNPEVWVITFERVE